MSATTHIRFRGDKQDTWAVSALNQIGPDNQAEIVYRTTNILYDVDGATGGDDGIFSVPPGTFGVDVIGKYLYTFEYNSYHLIQELHDPSVYQQDIICATGSADILHDTRILIVTSESIYVAKTGSNANDGSPAAPKLTIQAAIDAAVAAGATHVQVLDSGVYEECLDLKGITVEAASGQTPTITFPKTGFEENASLPSTAVQFSTFSIGGIPRLYAATDIGLYSSTDGISWSVAFLSGKTISGCCVHNGFLYVSNATDRSLHAITSSGSISTVASGDTWLQSGGSPLKGFSLPGLLVFATYTGRYYASIWDGGSWSFVETRGFLSQCVYDMNFSQETAFFATIDEDGIPYEFSTLNIFTKITSSHGLVASSISLISGLLYGTFEDGLKVMSSPFLPALWRDVKNQPWKNIGGVPFRIYVDSFSRPTVLARSGTNDLLYYSNNNGLAWSYIETPSAILVDYTSFFGVEVAVDNDVIGSVLVWDRRHVTSSIESSILSGCDLDGQDMAVDAYAGTVSFRHCRVRRHYQPCDDVAVSVAHRNTRFEDMKGSSFRGSSVIDCIIDRCEFARFTGAAVRITGPGVSVEECTITASGRGLMLEAAPKSVSGCIIYGNVVDIDSAVSGVTISQTCFDTKGGLPIVEDQCIIGNPLFVDETNDLRLKSRALGYAADSALLDDVDSGSGVDMRESIGARRYSRVLSSSEYGLDYMLHCNPGTVHNAYRPANYDKAYSQNGSMYGRETNPSAHKLARTLSWDSTGGEDAKTKAQAAMLRYIYGLDSVFDVGDSTDGTDFVPRRTGSKVSTFNCVSFGATDPLIAPNEHAGAWCIDEAGTIIGRIDSHTASYLSSGVYVIDITWQSGTDLPTATSVCKIDAFRRFRIDKTQPFSPVCQMPYVPGIISDIPTQYDITLEEVDE